VDENAVLLRNGVGGQLLYRDKVCEEGYCNYLPPSSIANALESADDLFFEVTPSGWVFTYSIPDSGGRLLSFANPQEDASNTWTLTYDYNFDPERISYLADPFDRRTTFAYSATPTMIQGIQEITDAYGRPTTFEVNGSGDLVRMTSPELCVTSLVYDVNHRLIAYVDPAGRRVSYTYL